jgi:hypothetical protein
MRGEPAAGCSAQQGIRQGADLVFPGAPESSKRQVFNARSSIVHQAAAGLGGDKGRPQSGPLHGPAPELADSPDSAAGQSASAGADGPLPDGATPNTSVRETDREAQSRSVEDTALNAADTPMLCGDSRGINAPADSVAEAGTRNHGRIKVTEQFSRTRFIASELYYPEAPNLPIRGAPRGRRSYCEAACSRPSPIRFIAQPHQQASRARPQWRRRDQPLLVTGKPSPPAGYKISFTGRCFRCLGRDHKLAACRDPLRCLACRRNGHLARDCPEKREGAHRPPIHSRLKFPKPTIHSRLTFPKPEAPAIHSRLVFPPLPQQAVEEQAVQEPPALKEAEMA